MIPYVPGKGHQIDMAEKIAGIDESWLYDLIKHNCTTFHTKKIPFTLDGKRSEMRLCRSSPDGMFHGSFRGTFEVADVFTLYIEFSPNSRKGFWDEAGNIQTNPAKIMTVEPVFYGDNTMDDIIHCLVMFRMTMKEDS